MKEGGILVRFGTVLILVIVVVAFIAIPMFIKGPQEQVITTPAGVPAGAVAWADFSITAHHHYVYTSGDGGWTITEAEVTPKTVETYSQHTIQVWQTQVTNPGFFGEGPYTVTLTLDVEAADCPSNAQSFLDCNRDFRGTSAAHWESGNIVFTGRGDDALDLFVNPPTVFFPASGWYKYSVKMDFKFERGEESQTDYQEFTNALIEV